MHVYSCISMGLQDTPQIGFMTDEITPLNKDFCMASCDTKNFLNRFYMNITTCMQVGLILYFCLFLGQPFNEKRQGGKFTP